VFTPCTHPAVYRLGVETTSEREKQSGARGFRRTVFRGRYGRTGAGTVSSGATCRWGGEGSESDVNGSVRRRVFNCDNDEDDDNADD